MVKVSNSTSLNASVNEVWQKIGKFGDLASWHPAVDRSRQEGIGTGSRRILDLADGNTILEELLSADDSSYTYGIVEGPLPVANYSSTLRISKSEGGSGCTVSWQGEFDPDGVDEKEASTVVSGIYEAGLKSLQEEFGG